MIVQMKGLQMVTIKLPKDVTMILERLCANGHSAFVVGGCVRDALIGLEPNDWDICTSALPTQTMAYFKGYQIIETGLQHGTITLMVNHEPYEITTYRIEGIYEDNRRPSHVEFTSDIVQDLARRDFTINAIAYAPGIGLVDPYHGAEGIQQKVIQCVGNGDQRFNEDALRIMRALRFASVLGYHIEETTSMALLKNKGLLKNIAIERINTEFCKLLLGPNVETILMDYQAIIATIIPEAKPMFGFNQNHPYHLYDVWQHTVTAISLAEKNLIVRLALFFHDISKPLTYTEDEQGTGHFYQHPKQSKTIAQSIMKRMRFDNDTINKVKELVYYHDAELKASKKVVRRWLHKMGEDNLRLLLKVKQADIMAQAEAYQEDRLLLIDAFTELMNTIIDEQQCFSLKDLAVNGADLIQIGIKPGPELGKTLNHLLDQVIDGQIENDKEKLLNFAKKSIIKSEV